MSPTNPIVLACLNGGPRRRGLTLFDVDAGTPVEPTPDAPMAHGWALRTRGRWLLVYGDSGRHKVRLGDTLIAMGPDAQVTYTRSRLWFRERLQIEATDRRSIVVRRTTIAPIVMLIDPTYGGFEEDDDYPLALLAERLQERHPRLSWQTGRGQYLRP